MSKTIPEVGMSGAWRCVDAQEAVSDLYALQIDLASKTCRIPPSACLNKSLGVQRGQIGFHPVEYQGITARQNTDKYVRFQRGSSCLSPFNRLSTPILICSLRPPLMSLNRERYRVFETLAPDEEEWSKREELFNAHGYNFRPRLRKGWTPSWHTTGESPLYSEDGEVLNVPQPLYHLILHIDNFVDPPC